MLPTQAEGGEPKPLQFSLGLMHAHGRAGGGEAQTDDDDQKSANQRQSSIHEHADHIFILF
jgi:hypothetical protein